MRFCEVSCALLFAACANGPVSSAKEPTEPATDATPSGDVFLEKWGEYESMRFRVKVLLPDGRGWRIEDQRTPWLLASHARTASTIRLRTWREFSNMTPERCEERARSWLDLPSGGLVSVRRKSVPTGFATNVAVSLSASNPEKPLLGNVVAFGSSVKRCFAYVFTTRESGKGAEERLAARLATIAERALPETALLSDLVLEGPSRPHVESAKPTPGTQ